MVKVCVYFPRVRQWPWLRSAFKFILDDAGRSALHDMSRDVMSEARVVVLRDHSVHTQSALSAYGT